MDALILWRDATLREKAAGLPTRPSSPLSEANSEEAVKSDEAASDDRLLHNRSQSEPVEKAPGSDASGKPTSSSWVQWWSRSRTNSSKDVNGAQAGRPALPNTASSPAASTVSLLKFVPLNVYLVVAETRESTQWHAQNVEGNTPCRIRSCSPFYAC